MLFDGEGKLREFSNTVEIIEEHFKIRYNLYEERHTFLLAKLAAEVALISNKSRFINLMLCKELEISGRPKKEILEDLISRGFLSDPVKEWKYKVSKKYDFFRQSGEVKRSEEEFGYLLDMSLMSLTSERVARLEAEVASVQNRLDELQRLTPGDLWLADLADLEEVLAKMEAERAKKAKRDQMTYLEPSSAAKLIKQEITPKVLKKYAS